MGDARAQNERLPWLDSPRGAKPRSRPRKTVPHGAIYTLLALFLIASIGVIAFLVGRSSVPIDPFGEAEQAVPPAATLSLPPATLVPEPAEPVAEVAEEAPAAPVAKPRRPTVKRRVLRAPPTNAALEATRKAQGERTAPSPDTPVSVETSAPPTPSPAPPPLIRASQVVQVGTYRSRWRADAAHRRLVKVYPYVGELTKVVRPIRVPNSSRSYYRLQYREHTPDYARILCRNLRAIGRGCAVLPQGR